MKISCNTHSYKFPHKNKTLPNHTSYKLILSAKRKKLYVKWSRRYSHFPHDKETTYTSPSYINLLIRAVD